MAGIATREELKDSILSGSPYAALSAWRDLLHRLSPTVCADQNLVVEILKSSNGRVVSVIQREAEDFMLRANTLSNRTNQFSQVV